MLDPWDLKNPGDFFYEKMDSMSRLDLVASVGLWNQKKSTHKVRVETKSTNTKVLRLNKNHYQ